MELPEKFLARMQKLLGLDYAFFLQQYTFPSKKGIRLNTLKSDYETVASAFDRMLEKSSFSDSSYYIPDVKIGEMPLHAAGAFYAQEPSASSAVAVLNPKIGDKVLDLCAAPGGKSTQIADCLQGKGLLWSNEIVKSRANILLSNIERMGVRNCMISSCHPDLLCNTLAGFFDKVLVDAPCSGEGMFRKNPEAVQEWSPEHVLACAGRQIAILDSASVCVKEEGSLVYSTCTFSKEENEDVCMTFLTRHPEFSLADPAVSFGRKDIGIRIYPMDGGEGHFVAKFLRTGANRNAPIPFHYPENTIMTAADFYRQLFLDEPFGKIIQIQDKLLILPEGLPEFHGLGVLRSGVELGIIKNGRIEPSHALFTCQKAENCRRLLNFNSADLNLHKFLHGEEILCDMSGYTAVSVDNVVLGFGKASNGVLKNRYPKGLRTKK